jgi:hypothetical protein
LIRRGALLFATYVCDGIMLRRDEYVYERMTHIQIFRLNKGRMGNDGHTDDIVERKIEHKAG